MTNAERFGAKTPEQVRELVARLRAMDLAVRAPLAELEARGL
jgi:hypothetical protein